MPDFFVYLLKANIVLTVFYAAYRFGLRRLTFYTLNRFFLLGGILSAVLLPLAGPGVLRHLLGAGGEGVHAYAPNWTVLQSYLARRDSFSGWDLAAYVFWAGVGIMAIRLVLQLFSLLRMHLRATPGTLEGYRVRVVAEPVTPFSFFRQIYIHPAMHDREALRTILMHEHIHVTGYHTLDILLAEVNHLFYWFNPGAWLMKGAIRENLEFLTDRKVLAGGADKRRYQYSLLKTSYLPLASPIGNHFQLASLKQRLRMMNARRSSGLSAWRYVVLVPVVALISLTLASKKDSASAATMVMAQVPSGAVDSVWVIPSHEHTFQGLKGAQVDTVYLTLQNGTGGDSTPHPKVRYTPPKVIKDSVVRPVVHYTPPKVVKDSVIRPRVRYTPPKVVKDSVIRPKVRYTPPKVTRDSVVRVVRYTPPRVVKDSTSRPAVRFTPSKGMATSSGDQVNRTVHFTPPQVRPPK